MKKILIAVISLTVSLSAYAQSNFAIGAGAVTRQISETFLGLETDNYFHTGFSIDAMYGYDFTNHFGINTGLRYIYLFQSDRSSALGAEKVDTEKDSFLDLPVHLKYTFNPSGFCKFFLTAGPTAELWTSYSTTFSIKYITEKPSKDSYTTNHFKDGPEGLFNKFNVSAGATLGLEIADAVRVSLAYDYYFLDMLKNTWGIQTSRMSKHQIRLGVAYVF